MRQFSIGVDLGGTNLRAAAYSPETGLRFKRSMQTRLDLGPTVVAENLCSLISEVLLQESSAAALLGICVGAPGPLELPTGRFHAPPNLPGWGGFNLRDAIKLEFDVPVTLENDANLAALAECHLGSGKELGLDELCMITLGTGVGTGIIAEGKIFHGLNGLAGEAGHASVWPDGELCACGNQGCLELYASATGILRRATALAMTGKASGLEKLFADSSEVTTSDLYTLAMGGDRDAESIFAQAGQAIGMSLATLVNILNPSLIAVAGGVSNAWPLLWPSMEKELLSRSFIYRLTQAGSSFQRHVVIRQAMLGDGAGLAGAALLPFINAVHSS